VPSDTFVTGGSGLLGGHLITQLVNDRYSVRALARSERSAKAVQDRGAQVVHGDLFDTDALREGMWGADIVFHVAGVNETCSRDPRFMDRVNIDGTAAVIEAASASGVRRVVYTSSAAAIGEQGGMIGTEHTVHSGDHVSNYARSKHLAETKAFDTADRLGVDLVAVNPSSVQGPGRATGSAELLLRSLNAKRPLLVDTTLSIVDIEDCTAGHIGAANHGRAGERYILSGATLCVADAVDLLSTAVGRTINPRWLSEELVRSLGMAGARVAAIVRPSLGICPELITTLLHGHRFDGSRAARELQFSYASASDTINRTVKWFKEQGLIKDI
jgi:dihydroflavonol-4-reductase